MYLALHPSRVRSSEVLAGGFRWRQCALKSAKNLQGRTALVVGGYAFTHDLSVPTCQRNAYERLRQDHRWLARGAVVEEFFDIPNATFSGPFVDLQEGRAGASAETMAHDRPEFGQPFLLRHVELLRHRDRTEQQQHRKLRPSHRTHCRLTVELSGARAD